MIKRINLSFAVAGDVAVLRNDEQREIKEIAIRNLIEPYKVIFTDNAQWDYQYYILGNYTPCHSLHSPFDIIDILRNGVSIF